MIQEINKEAAMIYPSRQYTARSAKRGAEERQRQREMIEAAGGWFAYFKGERAKREALKASAKAEDDNNKPGGGG